MSAPLFDDLPCPSPAFTRLGIITFLVANLVLPLPIRAQTAHLVNRQVISPDSAMLSFVMGLVVDKKERVHVLDWGRKQVLVLDGRGGLLTTIGRSGQGPGEFMTPLALGWHRDSLWVSDVSLRRLTWFTPEGSLLSTAARMDSLPPGLVTGARPLPAGVLADGRLVINFSTSSGRPVDRIPLLAWKPGMAPDTLLVYDFPKSVRFSSPNGRSTAVSVPFSNQILYALSPQGDWYGLIDRSGPPGSRPQVTVTTVAVAKGAHDLARWKVEIPSIAIPDHIRDSILTVLSLNMGLTPNEVARRLPIPRMFPGPTAVVAGADSTLWIRIESADPARATFLVFTLEGRLLATVLAPSSLNLMWAASKSVYGVETDGDGVPMIVRYQVRGVDKASME